MNQGIAVASMALAAMVLVMRPDIGRNAGNRETFGEQNAPNKRAANLEQRGSLPQEPRILHGSAEESTQVQ